MHPYGRYLTNIFNPNESIFGYYPVMDGNVQVGIIPCDGDNNFREDLDILNEQGFAVPVKVSSCRTCYGIVECLEYETDYKPNDIVIFPKFNSDKLEHFVIQNPPQRLDDKSRLIVRAISDKQGPWVITNKYHYFEPQR